MSLIDIENEEYRRDILQLLAQDVDYEMTEIILIRAMDDLGNRILRDRLQNQLRWLEREGYVALGQVASSGILTAKLTGRGLEVVERKRLAPNIAKVVLD